MPFLTLLISTIKSGGKSEEESALSHDMVDAALSDSFLFVSLQIYIESTSCEMGVVKVGDSHALLTENST